MKLYQKIIIKIITKKSPIEKNIEKLEKQNRAIDSFIQSYNI